MRDDRTLTTLEILSIAIRSEIDAARLYEKMKEMVAGEDLKEKMDYLISQEKKHEKILKEVYEKKFPEVELALPPKSVVPMMDKVLEGNASLEQLFAVGMKAELMAKDFYTELANKTNDVRAKSTLMYMANMEQSHHAILEAEWKQIETLKSREASDLLDSDGLLHVGP